MIWPGGKEVYWGSLQVSRILLRSSSLRRWSNWRLLPLLPSTPSPSPANYLRQRCSVDKPTPMSLASPLARASAVIPSPRILRALAIVRFRQSSPSLPQKTWIFLRQSTVLPPPPGFFPYGADPF